MKVKKYTHETQAQRLKSKLALAGIKQVDLAFKAKVSPSMICDVIAGRTISRRVRLVIAKALNKQINDLWPPATKKAA